MTIEFFQGQNVPRIYAYADTRYPGCLKVGYTTKSVQERVAAQYPVLLPGQSFTIVLDEPAVRDDGRFFTDHAVHQVLNSHGVRRLEGEWFECTDAQVRAAITQVQTGRVHEPARTQRFGLRPEQEAAIVKTMAYFQSEQRQRPQHTPHFLWNAKMRFGKTFAAYQLARRMHWKRVLVLTFKPAVQSAWEDDLKHHVDFSDWQFVASGGLSFAEADRLRPMVCFGSFQDYLGRNRQGGIKAKNEWVHALHWDVVILDEYHYGAWRENAKDLFEAESQQELKAAEGDARGWFSEDHLPITTGAYLYLSGTPFRALHSGEFIEDQIFNWTYSDEQKAKQAWPVQHPGEPNPYAALPRMVMLTYQLPDSIRHVALQGEYNEFDLNTFFAAVGDDSGARFTHESEVQKWLHMIRGALAETTVDLLKLGAEKPPMPFGDSRLQAALLHTFWYLPSVASCHAMQQLLRRKHNVFYQDYEVIVCAGNDAGMGVDALPPVHHAMGTRPLQTKTITLSCGKLTTGVSVPPWTGIFMLRNASSPETYFQAAFRVQTPWVLRGMDPNDPHAEVIVKEECYVFDFAPDRALRQIADYSCRLNLDESSPEEKVADFVQFLPVLAYDGSSMKQIDAAGILDMAMSGTTATLLAKRWESALLVNVDNTTLERLMNSPEAMRALMSIEGFRQLNQDIQTIINQSNAVRAAKQKANDQELTPSEKKQMTEAEKEYKKKRKEIQEKLIKFATRVPVFMYLTDFREQKLQDVITQLEPGLFKKVTGLSKEDFGLLASLNVFNSALMNDAVYKFKRYEDASLEYTGISRWEGGATGLFDTVIKNLNS